MIVAFTGAGISKASGIQTFMETPEVRDQLYRSFALNHPDQYKETVRGLVDVISKAKPNDAHRALADYNIPVITMNIDRLHEQAGSETVIALHGVLPEMEELEYADQLFNKPVLYGDPAPNYQKAINRILKMETGDTLLVIGASRYTQIAVQLREIAYSKGARIVEVQENAEVEVRKILEKIMNKS
ncbi:transcriptional regulator [Erysipelothrix sp. HDW6C]|uniref:Sir2 family NAD-dependent protein deacetylase n=1 Tax=Erysipelothrix sp. HDW6C TaxID=2714930 RepID=UPI00140E4D64|nr:Sir2 family NAD-dependent protein deacetylase [Erysipelothrix sp. HDW6C]QIK69047.1 transcriptional regulator [Erysipelothrix sp. HDW6C]